MRNVAFLLVGILLVVLQGFFYRLAGPIGIHGITPSLTLPLIIFLGVHEPSTPRGAFLAFGIGYALDLFAGAPIGLFTFVSVALWWLARVAGVRLTTQTLITRMSLAFGFALLEGAIILTLLAVFGSDNRRPLEMASVLLPHAIATGIVAPFVFRLAQRLHQGSVPVHGSEAETR